MGRQGMTEGQRIALNIEALRIDPGQSTAQQLDLWGLSPEDART